MKLFLVIAIALVVGINCQFSPALPSDQQAQCLFNAIQGNNDVNQNCNEMDAADLSTVCADSACLRLVEPILERCGYDLAAGELFF